MRSLKLLITCQNYTPKLYSRALLHSERDSQAPPYILGVKGNRNNKPRSAQISHYLPQRFFWPGLLESNGKPKIADSSIMPKADWSLIPWGFLLWVLSLFIINKNIIHPVLLFRFTLISPRIFGHGSCPWPFSHPESEASCSARKIVGHFEKQIAHGCPRPFCFCKMITFFFFF